MTGIDHRLPSDPGSSIEPFRQKIPFHNKLADLGVKLGDLAIPALLALGALVVKHLGKLLDRLALPGRIWVGCSSCLVASSATVS